MATRPHLIAGHIPEPTIPMADDLRQALDVRRDAIEQRTTELARLVLAEQPIWLRELGPQPTDPAGQARWMSALRSAVAFRDLHGITGDRMLGGRPHNNAQTDQKVMVRRAVGRITPTQPGMPPSGLPRNERDAMKL